MYHVKRTIYTFHVKLYIITVYNLLVNKNIGNKAKNKEIGRIGEEIAGNYLIKKGFTVLSKNYLKKWGEIDIVSRETNKIHFIEVKTVSYETKVLLDQAVTRRTWRPEENVHAFKIKKLSRAIESWVMENDCNLEWQIDIVAIRIVPREKYASVKYIPNVIL